VVVLPSLAAQTYDDFEVVVVDDSSSDDSLAYLGEHWPEVAVVSTGERNVGVSAALNVAVRAASGELVALLNNDLELEPDWLAELVDALDRHPEAASVAGKLLRYSQREKIDSAGDIFTSGAAAFGRGAGERDAGQYDVEEEVFAPTAGAALYRVRTLAEVGPFDESFHAYFEDVDWGLRALLLGHRSRYVPSARGYHMGSRTTRPTVNRRFYELQHRNTLGVIVKDVPLPFIVRHAPQILAHHLLALAYSTRAGLLGAHLRGIAQAVAATPGWLRARRRIQRSRRISPAEFERRVAAGRR
jgi:GT2 family glycosyltransferase